MADYTECESRDICDEKREELSAAEKRIEKLEAALDIVLSVRMLDNLTAEQWATVQAARRK